MKRFFLLCFLLFAASAWGVQGSVYFRPVISPTGQALPGATIYACQIGATGNPCSPQQAIYTDQTLTTQITQPTFSDINGNMSFGCLPGTPYVFQVTANFVTLTYVDICPGNGSLIGSNTWTGSNIFTGPVTISGTITLPNPLNVGQVIATAFTGPVGNISPNTGVFTSLSSSSGALNGSIGATTPSTGVFTTITSPTFAGTTSFTGQDTFTLAPIIPGAVDSSCGTPASAGFLRLCRPSAINWRNVANNGDEGMSIDSVDALLLTTAGGITMTGAVPGIHFGGESNLSGAIFPSGTTLRFRLADNSGDAPLSASLGTFSAHIAVDGVTINASSPSNGQVLQATSGSTASWQTPTISKVQQRITATQGGNTGIAASPSSTTVQTQAVTMPSSGCPCSVFISWGQFAQQGASGQTIGWINDGSSSMATGMVAAPGSASLLFLGGAAWSPTLYSNSATPTFSLIESQSAGGGGNNALASSGFGTSGQQNSWMNITVFTNSN
jgi:hypothetical protein